MTGRAGRVDVVTVLAACDCAGRVKQALSCPFPHPSPSPLLRGGRLVVLAAWVTGCGREWSCCPPETRSLSCPPPSPPSPSSLSPVARRVASRVKQDRSHTAPPSPPLPPSPLSPVVRRMWAQVTEYVGASDRKPVRASDHERVGASDGATETSPGQGKGAPCKFFLSDQGCRRGASCKYSHDVDKKQRQGRCWTCGSKQHVAKACPTKKNGNPRSPTRTAGNKPESSNATPSVAAMAPEVAHPMPPAGTSPTSSVTATSTSSTTTASAQPTSQSNNGVGDSDLRDLLKEANNMLKEMRRLQRITVLDVEAKAKALGMDPGDGRTGLLDSGASHAFRQGTVGGDDRRREGLSSARERGPCHVGTEQGRDIIGHSIFSGGRRSADSSPGVACAGPELRVDMGPAQGIGNCSSSSRDHTSEGGGKVSADRRNPGPSTDQGIGGQKSGGTSKDDLDNAEGTMAMGSGRNMVQTPPHVPSPRSPTGYGCRGLTVLAFELYREELAC